MWDGIISDALGFISRIEGAIGGLGHDVLSIPGKVLSAIGMAGGGIVPGSGGGDHVAALLTPGETVVSKAHSALLAPSFAAVGVPGYAGGGVAGSYGAIRRYAGGWSGNSWSGGAGTVQQAASYGGGITLNFYGTSWPSPEQQQAMSLMLTSAISNA